MPAVVTADIGDALAGLTDIQEQQLPFAMALALTWTAMDAKPAVQATVRGRFTLRNAWTERGVGIEPARKGRNPESAVTFDRQYMQLQDEGGEKLAHRGHKYICIPIAPELKAGIIPDNLRPKWLLGLSKTVRRMPRLFTHAGRISKKAQAFAATYGKGWVATIHGKPFIMMRYGRAEHDVKVMYFMATAAQIKPRLKMRDTVVDTVNKTFQPNFQKAMAQAMAGRGFSGPAVKR